MKARTGIKSMFSLELAQEICDRISNDESLASICRDKHMPSPVTVWNWQRAHPEFREAYKQARINQANTIADGLCEIRKKLWNGRMAPSRANSLFNIVKWEAAVRDPDTYGGKSAIDQEQEGIGNYDLSKLTDDELREFGRLARKSQPDRDPA